ncbi:MAG: efflux RND transporter periplasmic adaptor subunit [Pseudomonadales bacterium]|nr:efflux RND transporter periplasmic adaptor subunit [Pseudomonadales bacterium]
MNTTVPTHRRTLWVIVAIMVILASAGIMKRQHHRAELQREATNDAIMQVTVLTPLLASTEHDLILPGTVMGWRDAAIRARSNGYIRSWVKDIGDTVRSGDILATVTSPEIDAQTEQARADLATAQANLQLARITAERWQHLVKTRTVSQQDLEDKEGDLKAKITTVASARAHLQNLMALKGFELIRAPFTGVVSARTIDIGDLVSASSAQELFHLVDNQQLRIMVQVPQEQQHGIQAGIPIDLSVAEHPGHKFPATLLKLSGGLDPASRTRTVELRVDNADHLIQPGDYATVDFHATSGQSWVIPITALIFRGAGLQLATITPQQKVHLQTVIPGRDFGKSMEIHSDWVQNRSIIDNPSDSISEGQTVKIVGRRTLSLNDGDKSP